MEGYVRNISRTWRHALKRSIAPGQKIDLDVLYAEYGEKHGIEEGKPFVDWIRSVKLKDANTWEVSYREPMDIPDELPDVEQKENKEADSTITESVEAKPKPDNVAPFNPIKQEVMDIVDLSVRKAKEDLPKIMDIKLLKAALHVANTQAGKDTLTRMLRKRVKELELATRR